MLGTFSCKSPSLPTEQFHSLLRSDALETGGTNDHVGRHTLNCDKTGTVCDICGRCVSSSLCVICAVCVYTVGNTEMEVCAASLLSHIRAKPLWRGLTQLGDEVLGLLYSLPQERRRQKHLSTEHLQGNSKRNTNKILDFLHRLFDRIMHTEYIFKIYNCYKHII